MVINPPNVIIPEVVPFTIESPTSVPKEDPKCPKCGITLSQIMMYYCSHNDCPTGLGSSVTLKV